MMFTCVSMVLTLTIFAYILGEISNLVMDQDAELVKTRSQVCSMLTSPSLYRSPTQPKSIMMCAGSCLLELLPNVRVCYILKGMHHL